MCSLRAFVIVALALLAGGAVHAQTHEELAARAAAHRARIDSLLPLYEEAQARNEQLIMQRQRKAAARLGTLDTVRTGPFLVVGRPKDVAAAAPVFERAWSEYEPIVGSAAARLEGAVFVVRGDGGEFSYRLAGSRPRHYLVDLPSMIRYRDRTRMVRAAMGKPLRLLLPTAVQTWVGEGSFGAGREMDRAYRELAVGDSRGAEQCHDGDIDSCAGVLGLTSDTTRLHYYSPTQRREMVRRRRVSGAEYGNCVEFKNDAACVTMLNRYAAVPLPLSAHTRAVLLEHALIRGGAGSFERMIADSTVDVAAALAVASGMDRTQLLSSWRETVLDARPNAAAWLGGTFLVTLFWIGVLILLASRSTRWRIG